MHIISRKCIPLFQLNLLLNKLWHKISKGPSVSQYFPNRRHAYINKGFHFTFTTLHCFIEKLYTQGRWGHGFMTVKCENFKGKWKIVNIFDGDLERTNLLNSFSLIIKRRSRSYLHNYSS